MTVETTRKTNRNGKPCQPWCDSRHGIGETACISDPIGSVTSSAPIVRIIGRPTGHAFKGAPNELQVACGFSRDPKTPSIIYINPDQAERFAVLVEQLAGCTPADLQLLADALRVAGPIAREEA